MLHESTLNKTLLLISLYILLIGYQNNLNAQSETTYKLTALALQARVDYQNTRTDSHTKSGFAGQYLNTIINAEFSEKLAFNYRQRLNISNTTFSSFFQGTDWLYLTYKPTKNIALSGGKQVVLIGGYEYDAAPIDTYVWSNFWNNVVCYEMGADISFTDNKKHNTLKFQVSNSPFVQSQYENIYAYNLIWYGKLNEHFQTIYSANAIEYEDNSYIYYLALGNKFTSDNVSFYVDFMSRFDQVNKIGFNDYSIMSKVNIQVKPDWNLFFKGSYDTNTSQPKDIDLSQIVDRYVLPGTEQTLIGIGSEYFPISDKSIRLHAFTAYQNPNKVNTFIFNIGVKWHFDFLKLKSS